MSTQTNTRAGDIVLVAGADLTGKEGCLVKLTSAGAVLPSADTDLAVYVVVDGNGQGKNVTLRPLSGERNVRIKLAADCSMGDILVVDATTGGVKPLPEDPGSYRAVAVAEEAGKQGALVLARPYAIGTITVE